MYGSTSTYYIILRNIEFAGATATLPEGSLPLAEAGAEGRHASLIN